MNIIEKLKRERKKQGVSVSEMANRLFVTKGTVYEFEKGQHSPTFSSLEKYARALGLDIEAEIKTLRPE
jgi:transcriptional regulator with XRE-family HTH domain